MILSIETSTKVCSVALQNEYKEIAVFTLSIEKSHAEKLSLLIKDLLAYAGVKAKELVAVAISSGPGSYTGLRIGTSTAKGLCYALNIPLIAINTLEAMAFGVSQLTTENLLLCPMIDARRMEVYCMLLDEKLTTIKKTEAKIIDKLSFKEELSSKKIIFFGDGADKCKPILDSTPNAIFLNNQSISAAHLKLLAWHKYVNKTFEDIAYFEPLYLKEFVSTKPKNLFL